VGRETISVEVLTPSDEQSERTYRLKAQGYNLERLAQRVAPVFQMPPDRITSLGCFGSLEKVQQKLQTGGKCDSERGTSQSRGVKGL